MKIKLRYDQSTYALVSSGKSILCQDEARILGAKTDTIMLILQRTKAPKFRRYFVRRRRKKSWHFYYRSWQSKYWYPIHPALDRRLSRMYPKNTDRKYVLYARIDNV